MDNSFSKMNLKRKLFKKWFTLLTVMLVTVTLIFLLEVLSSMDIEFDDVMVHPYTGRI